MNKLNNFQKVENKIFVVLVKAIGKASLFKGRPNNILVDNTTFEAIKKALLSIEEVYQSQDEPNEPLGSCNYFEYDDGETELTIIILPTETENEFFIDIDIF